MVSLKSKFPLQVAARIKSTFVSLLPVLLMRSKIGAPQFNNSAL